VSTDQPSARAPSRNKGVEHIVWLYAGDPKVRLTIDVGKWSSQDSKAFRPSLGRRLVVRHWNTSQNREADLWVYFDEKSLAVRCQYAVNLFDLGQDAKRLAGQTLSGDRLASGGSIVVRGGSEYSPSWCREDRTPPGTNHPAGLDVAPTRSGLRQTDWNVDGSRRQLSGMEVSDQSVQVGHSFDRGSAVTVGRGLDQHPAAAASIKTGNKLHDSFASQL
jgi:hypothetical protein